MMRIALLVLLATVACAADAWDELATATRLQPAEARTALEKLLVQHPDFAAARFNLGTLLLESDPAKAAEQLELATTATDPGMAADAFFNLALARFKQGRLDEALVAAEQAARRDPQAAALRDEIRRVALARRDEARRTAEEEAKKLHLGPQPLPTARVGQPYHATLPIRGGTPPATVALAGSSTMPPGLALAADGTITGTPTTAGTVHLDLALQDHAGTKATGKTDLTVKPEPAITTASLPEAVLGQPYQIQLASEGFDGPVTWAIAALPAGLTGGSDGRIAGTPTAAGRSGVHIHAGDGTLSADRLLDLMVSDTFAPAEDPLPPATATAPYQHRETVRGPAQEYRWSGGGGGELAIAADGTISGTPAQAGTVQVPATISAADGRSRQVTLRLPVNPLPLIEPEPVQLQVGEPVDRPIKVEGGTPPYVWSSPGGSLPVGVRLDPDGHLRGSAQDPGSFTATVAVADHWKADTQAELKITVEASSHPPPQGKQDKEDKGQAKQDQPPKDQLGKQSPQGTPGDQGKSDKQQGQQGKDQQQAQTGTQDQGTDDKQGQGQQADQQQAAAGKAGETKDDPAAQAQAMNQTAADHWLDQLPQERRDALRYQLLDGGAKRPKNQGKTW